MYWFKSTESKSKGIYTIKDIDVISDVSEKILSTQKLEELLQQAVDKVVTRYGFLGGIFLLKEGNEIFANTISKGRVAMKFLEYIDMPVTALRTNIKENPKNYIVRSITKKEVVIGSDLNDFTLGVIPEKVSSMSKKLTNTRSCISIPVHYEGSVFGAFFISESKVTDFSFELPILKAFANQLGIAIVNSRLYEATQDQIVKLEDSNRELTALRRREQDMMDIMGHELRTPLSIIKITIGLLQRQYEKDIKGEIEGWHEYLVRITGALERETRLLEAMLSSTKVEANKVELHFEKVDINSIVRDAMLALGSKAQKKKLPLIYNTSQPKIFVYADSVRLGEVVDNLVLNAIKYTEKGFITINAIEKGDKIEISVQDTGIGIPEEDIPHLGEKFYRVGQYSNNQKDREKRSHLDESQLVLIKPGGTGLGLYVSYNLVKLMGGEITVKSEVGKGSTFSFSLPKYTNQPKTHSKQIHHKNLFERLGFTQHKS